VVAPLVVRVSTIEPSRPYAYPMLTIIALIVAVLFVPSPWNIVLVVVAALVDIAETGAFVWWSRRRRRLSAPAVGTGAIVGRTGIALERLDPTIPGRVGQVRVDGEIWGARSTEPVDPGDAVRVRSVVGLVLDVEPNRPG
jgi:membrane protein implicated in regulation of membrane protease activity